QWPASQANVVVAAIGAAAAGGAAIRAQAATTRRGFLAEAVPLTCGMALLAVGLGTPLGLVAALTGVLSLAVVGGLAPLGPAAPRARRWGPRGAARNRRPGRGTADGRVRELAVKCAGRNRGRRSPGVSWAGCSCGVAAGTGRCGPCGPPARRLGRRRPRRKSCGLAGDLGSRRGSRGWPDTRGGMARHPGGRRGYSPRARPATRRPPGLPSGHSRSGVTRRP